MFSEGWELYLARDFIQAHRKFYSLYQSTTDIHVKNRALDAALFMLIKLDEKELYISILTEAEKNSPALKSIVPHQEAYALYTENYGWFWELNATCAAYQRALFGPWNRGINSTPSGPDWPSLYQKQYENRETGAKITIAPLQTNKDICLFSCDARYFLEFSDIPLRSARDVGWDVHFHFHIINPDESVKKALDKIVHEYDASYSSETVENPQKAYFASARYMLAHDILRQNAAALWIMDIDVKYKNSLDINFDQYGWDRHKPGVRYTSDLTLPWQKMTANAMYIPNNDIGLEYTRLISLYLCYYFYYSNSRKDLWWIDQNAIFFSLLHLQQNQGISFQVWGERLKSLVFPKLFSDKRKNIMSE